MTIDDPSVSLLTGDKRSIMIQSIMKKPMNHPQRLKHSSKIDSNRQYAQHHDYQEQQQEEKYQQDELELKQDDEGNISDYTEDLDTLEEMIEQELLGKFANLKFLDKTSTNNHEDKVGKKSENERESLLSENLNGSSLSTTALSSKSHPRRRLRVVRDHNRKKKDGQEQRADTVTDINEDRSNESSSSLSMKRRLDEHRKRISFLVEHS